MKREIKLVKLFDIKGELISKFDFKSSPYELIEYLHEINEDTSYDVNFGLNEYAYEEFIIEENFLRSVIFNSENQLKYKCSDEIISLENIKSAKFSNITVEYSDEYFFKTPNSTVIGFKIQDEEYVKMYNISSNGTLTISNERIEFLDSFIIEYEKIDENEMLFYREMRNFTF